MDDFIHGVILWILFLLLTQARYAPWVDPQSAEVFRWAGRAAYFLGSIELGIGTVHALISMIGE